MTKSELKQYDGRNGAKAYIAYQGKVYDVTESPLWEAGEHEGMHQAGVDLTAMLANAPHGVEVFKAFEVVAELEEEPSETPLESDDTAILKQELKGWYKKYHPHPMLVHFPIALHLFAAGLDLLFFEEPKATYATAVFYTFFVATMMGLLAMLPGMLSWWVNYDLSRSPPFIIKMVVATITLVLGVVAIFLYMEEPGIVYEFSFEGIVYHAIILSTGVNVIILGYYGGKITWGSDHREEEVEESIPGHKEVGRPAQTEADVPKRQHYEVPFLSDLSSPPVTLAQEQSEERSEAAQKSIAILIGGAAGTGLDSLERLLDDAFRSSGFYLFSTKEYMSRVRGGSNTILIRIAESPLEAPCWSVDLFAALDADALVHARERCTQQSLILADETIAKEDTAVTALPMSESLKGPGGMRHANTYMAGVVFGLLGLDPEPLLTSVRAAFKGDDANEAAILAGLRSGQALERPSTLVLPQAQLEVVAKSHLMDGTTASGFGFLLGGCDFVASYPMSPSTGVLNFMASMSREFKIMVEQSEDEIASLHMVLGAWYAGARAMTTTSGGGFALMGEALSLAGMTETPAVIYLAQRPGPATGLPTRSEQGDLNMALYSGHGPFPRVVLAPGSLRECVDLGYLAFELADRYQVPVIVLSDQYLADSAAMIRDIDFSAYEQRRYVMPTEQTYQRYADTKSGISPRGLPGLGEGLVCAVGDEHDESAQITEDHRVREQMVAKRARKESTLLTQALAPEYRGDGEIAVVGWGSTRGVIAEALRRLDDERVMQVHFGWVHPLDPSHLERLKQCKQTIVIENNADGAFADRLGHHGVVVDRRILQSNGFAFFVDQLAHQIMTVIKELS